MQSYILHLHSILKSEISEIKSSLIRLLILLQASGFTPPADSGSRHPAFLGKNVQEVPSSYLPPETFPVQDVQHVETLL